MHRIRLTLSLLLSLTFLLVISACSPAPTSVPPTPIPGYVAGEEKYAYTSFIQYYKEEVVDCSWTIYTELNIATVLDTDYQGQAVYVGNGIWRFYIRVGTYSIREAKYEYVEPTYEEKMVQVRSLPDRTWEDMCNRRSYDRNDEWVADEPN